MKVKTIIVGLLFLFLLWIFPPYIFIRLNDYFGLPIYDFIGLRVVGLIFLIMAVLMDIYLFVLFKIFGKGTPVPIQPSKKLIAVGPYKRTRNPMYLGHLMIYFGLFLYLGHFGLFLLFILAVIGLHFLVIMWEEPDLKKRLGEPYNEYLLKVPRWF